MKVFVGYLIVGLLRLIGRIPFPVAQRLGVGLGRLLLRFRNRSREVARVNLQLVYPQLTETDRQVLLREVLEESGKAGAEMGTMWGGSPDKGRQLIRKVHNPEILTAALQSGRGVLLCVPHHGNWEVLNHLMTLHTPLTAMYRPAKNPVLDRWMRSSREQTGIGLVPTTRSGVMALFRGLEAGGVVAILPDQEPKLQSGVFAPFMGVETLTPKLPHDLLRKTGAVAIFAFAERLPDAQGFEVHFLQPDDAIYSDDARTSASAMNKAIERCVAVCPAQYQWTYKRFKCSPDSEGGINRYKNAGVR